MSASIILLRQIKRGRLSEGERDQIADLVDRGMGVKNIALRLNRHPSTINNELVRIGEGAPKHYRTTSYKRGGSIVRPFSPDEDAWIVALRVQGYTWAKIGELCGKRYGHTRRPATIGTRLRQLAAVPEDHQASHDVG